MSTGRVAHAASIRYPRLRLALAATLLMLASAVVPGAVNAEQPANPGSAAESASSQRAEAVIAAAREYVGTPYRVGTEGPATIDCSGLVFRAFANAGELRQIGGSRLRAAGYRRWFAGRSLLTTDPEQVERGDLVMYAHGKHIGIYLGDGRVISALVTGVTVHSLDGITLPVTGYLAVDWTGKRGPFHAPVLPADVDEPEAPAALVPAAPWMPADPRPEVLAGPQASLAERVDMRTANSRTFATAPGEYATEILSRPIHFQPTGSDEWQPIDLRFRAAGEADDFAALAAHSPVHLALRVSSVEHALLAATSGETTISLAPRGAREDALPELSPDSRFADYRDLLGAGVGLRVLPRADGFNTFLVLADKPVTRSFAFGLDAAGLIPSVEQDGSVALRDAAGAIVGRFTKPMLLDSSDVDGEAGGVRADAAAFGVEAADDGSYVLSLTVEQAALDEAVYPAYVGLGLVDFPNSSFAAQHTFVSSYHPDGNFSTFQRPESGYAELWHGRRPERGDDNEAYLRFPGLAALLRGATVGSSTLQLFPYWQGGSATASATWLGRVAGDWDLRTVTWNTRPTAVLDATTYDTTQGEWTAMDVAAYVRDVASGASDYGLVVHADGAGRGHWKRFVAESGLEAGALEPRIVVRWSGLRPTLGAATVTGDVVELAWTNSDLAPASTRVHVQLSTDGFSTVERQLRVKQRSTLATDTASLPIADLPSGSHSWRVRARYADDSRWSAWSDAGTFALGVTSAPSTVFHQSTAFGY